MELLIDGKPEFVFNCKNVQELQDTIENSMGLNSTDYYLISSGKCVDFRNKHLCGRIHLVPRVLGGKGGFGSMLRAIGAQIEKTTNREACRDLSGRRLRDINEEQRLKNWINQQAEREKEAKERKQKKLERMCEAPKHEFRDEQYEKERSKLPEVVEDAVLQGLQASCSTKRKSTEHTLVVKTKKRKLWVDDEIDDLSASDDADSDLEENKESLKPCTIQNSERSTDSDCMTNKKAATENENECKKSTGEAVGDTKNDEEPKTVEKNENEVIENTVIENSDISNEKVDTAEK